MEPDSNLADESPVPADDDPELTEDGHFVSPEEAESFLDAAVGVEDDGEEEAEVGVEDDDDDHCDASGNGGDDDRDFDFGDPYSGDDNSDDDFGGVSP